MEFSRRDFLRFGGFTAYALAGGMPKLKFLETIQGIDNPLAFYPARDWEKVYRDQYRYDRTFTFVCSPNDTHSCRLRAYVRNEVVTRIEQAYDVSSYEDLYGNKATPIWNPRGCLKGYTVHRRVYGPYRVKFPVVRKGFKEWVEAGFPRQATGLPSHRFFQRGTDSWVKVSWDEAATLVAKALQNVVENYGGQKGHRLLSQQGYPEDMLEAMHESGAQTVKLRAGMWLLGITRIGALYRMANALALVDAKVRNVGSDKAYGGRGWTNYDWHGDLPPGHPMVTGIQTFDMDINDFRHAKLMIFMGKNMVENKMPEAHWWIELMERGGKIVVIAPEYSPASTKADYWITLRPGTDPALQLGVTNILFKEKLYDAPFVKRFTDMPLLVRLDTLKLLRASDIFTNYKNQE